MAPNENAAALITDAKEFSGSAPVRLMQAGFIINALRTNALLRDTEWQEIDRAVVDIARAQLNGIADLRQYGLVHPLGGLGTILTAYDLQSDMTDANIDMSGVTPGEEDKLDFTQVNVPVPIVHKDFRLNIRQLEASRRMGDGLDVSQSQVATRKVVEGLEGLLFNGSTMKVNGNSIYGYTTHPNRNTMTGADWGTIANIYTNVNSAVAAAEADNYYGPYGLYVASAQYAQTREVYTDGSGQTAAQRCLASIPSLKYIKPSSKLTDGTAVLVTLQKDVVDLAIAQDIVPVEWDAQGGLVQFFKVMCAMVPRVKADADSKSGIVHISGI
jgi:uncharacterized linocin/CFP29 family protein